MILKLQVIFITEINKKPKNRLLPIFSPDFTLNGRIGLIYAEKWIFLKKLGILLNQKPKKSPFADFFTWFYIKWPDWVVLCWKVNIFQKAWYFA